jgi:peptidoglycan/xylan/chitin deacetylase (PgdA/CDA1 family)
MARAGIEFGSHTLTHPRLPSVPRDRARKEISVSKARIEDLLGAQVLSFAYPYAEYSEQTKELVAEAGYRYAVAGDHGPSVFYEDMLEIRRVQIFPWTGTFGFWKKTRVWYHWYKDLKH